MSSFTRFLPLLTLFAALPAQAESLFISNNCDDDRRTCAKVQFGDSERADVWAHSLRTWSTADHLFSFRCTLNTPYDTERGCEFYFRSSASRLLTAAASSNRIELQTGRIIAVIENPSDVAELSSRLPSTGERTARALRSEGGTDRELSLRCEPARCTVTYSDPLILDPASRQVRFNLWPEAH